MGQPYFETETERQAWVNDQRWRKENELEYDPSFDDGIEKAMRLAAGLSCGTIDGNAIVIPIIGTDRRTMTVSIAPEAMIKKHGYDKVSLVCALFDIIKAEAEKNDAVMYDDDNFPLWEYESFIESGESPLWLWDKRQFTEPEEKTIMTGRLEGNPGQLKKMMMDETGRPSWIKLGRTINELADAVRQVKNNEHQDYAYQSLAKYTSTIDDDNLPIQSWGLIVDKQMPTLAEECEAYYKEHQRKPFEDNSEIKRLEEEAEQVHQQEAKGMLVKAKEYYSELKKDDLLHCINGSKDAYGIDSGAAALFLTEKQEDKANDLVRFLNAQGFSFEDMEKLIATDNDDIPLEGMDVLPF